MMSVAMLYDGELTIFIQSTTKTGMMMVMSVMVNYNKSCKFD